MAHFTKQIRAIIILNFSQRENYENHCLGKADEVQTVEHRQIGVSVLAEPTSDRVPRLRSHTVSCLERWEMTKHS